MKNGLYQEMSENKSIPQEKYLPKISLKKYLPNILKRFSTNRFSREIRTNKKKISEEKSLK